MPFGLKNTKATYERDMVTLFLDMKHKKIKVYVDDVIAKSTKESEYVGNLRKFFQGLKKFQLKLNLASVFLALPLGKCWALWLAKEE